jgi:hypothetical protein
LISRVSGSGFDALAGILNVDTYGFNRAQTELTASLCSLLSYLLRRLLKPVVDNDRAASHAEGSAHHLAYGGQRHRIAASRASYENQRRIR